MGDFDSLFAQVSENKTFTSAPPVAKEKVDWGSLFNGAPQEPAKEAVPSASKYPDVMAGGQALGTQKQDVVKPTIDYAPADKWKVGLDYSQSKDTVADVTNSNEIVAAAGARFDRSLAGMVNQLDFVQTTLGDAVNQIFFGRKVSNGIKEIRDKYGIHLDEVNGQPNINSIRPFKAIYDAINFCAEGTKELPNTVVGNIVGGIADIGPQILATYATPEIAAGKLLSKYGIDYFSKFSLVMGAQGLIKGAQDTENENTLQKLTTPIIKGIEQGATGVLYDFGGVISVKVGGRLAEKFIPEFKNSILNGVTKGERMSSPFSHPDIQLTSSQSVNKMLVNSLGTTAFNANLIGGYGSLVEFLGTGDTSWKTYATGAGMGIAMSGKEVGKLMWSKGMNSLISADPTMIQRSLDSPASSEELITLAQTKFKSISDGTSKNPEGDAAAGFLATRAAVLKGMLEEIQTNPGDVVKSITESTMPTEAKNSIVENIQQLIADNNPAVVEARPLNEKIAAFKDEIKMNKDNPNLAPADVENMNKPLALKMDNLTSRVSQIHEKYAKAKTPAEQAAADAKLAEDTKQANMLETKAAIVFPKFNDQLTAIANTLNADVSTRLKTPESMAGKSGRGNTEVKDIPDVIGGAIILPDMDSFKAAAKKIKEAFPDVKFSNKRVGNKTTGWKGITATMTVDGINTEIQFHTKETFKAHQDALKLTNQYRNGIEDGQVPNLQETVVKPSIEGLTSTQTDRIRIKPTENGVQFKDPTQAGYTEIKTPEEADVIKQTALADIERVKAEVDKRAEAKASDALFKILGNTYSTKEAFIQGLKDTFGGKNFDTEVLMSDDLKFDASVTLPEIMKIIDEVSPSGSSKTEIPIELRSSGELKVAVPFLDTRIKIADNTSKFLNATKKAEEAQTTYETNMAQSKKLYDEAYAGLENVNLEGSSALTPAQKKAKELGLPIVQQAELSKAWTETKQKIVGELKDKNIETKQAFKDFLKTMPPLAHLNVKLQTRMLAKVNAIDFTKPASLGEAVTYFDNIVNRATFRYEEAKAEQALDILIKKSPPESLIKKVSGQPDKNVKGFDGLPLWDVLTSVHNDMLNKDWAEGQKKILDIWKNADAEQRGVTAAEMDQITKYNFYGALNSTNKADVEGLQEMARDLMNIRRKGMSDAVVQKMVTRAQDEERLAGQRAVMQGNGRKMAELDSRKAAHIKDSPWKKFKGLFDWPGSSSIGSHLDFLSQYDKTSKPGESFLNKSLEEPLWNANLQNYSDIRDLHNFVNEAFSDIWGVSKNKSRSLAKENTATIHTIRYKDIAGQDQTLDLTTNEAIKVYMELQDLTLEKSHEAGYYKRNGELTSLGQGILDVLTPEAKAWGDWQLNIFYPKMREILNPVYRQFYGMDMPYGTMHSPIFVDIDKKAISDDDLLSKQTFMSGIKNGSLLARVQHSKPLRFMDCDKVLEAQISNMMYWKNYTEPLQLWRSFVHDPEIRAAIKQNFTVGKDHLAYLEKDIDYIMRKPSDQWLLTKALVKIRNNIMFSSLMAKVPIGINQVASSLAYAEMIPVKDMPKYGIENLWHWLGDKGNVALAKKLWNSTYIQQRYNQGFDVVMQDVMKSDYENVGGISKLADWRNKLMAPLSVGDFSAILLGGIPVYRYTYDQAMKKYKGNTRMAEIEAMHVFSTTTDRTQQSGIGMNQSYVQGRGGNEFTKSMTMYKSANMQYQRMVSEAFRGLVHGRGTIRQNVKTLVLYHVVLPMVYQWFANGFKWNTEDEIQAGALGNLNDLFVAGDMIDGVINTIRGETWKKYNVSPILGSWEDIVNTTTHLMKIKTTKHGFEKELTAKGITDPETISYAIAEAEKMHLYDMNWLELGKALKYASKVAGAATGAPVPAAFSMYTGISKVVSGESTGGPVEKIMTVLGSRAYTGKDAANDSNMTPEQVEELMKQKNLIESKKPVVKKPVVKPEKEHGKIPNF